MERHTEVYCFSVSRACQQRIEGHKLFPIRAISLFWQITLIQAQSQSSYQRYASILSTSLDYVHLVNQRLCALKTSCGLGYGQRIPRILIFLTVKKYRKRLRCKIQSNSKIVSNNFFQATHSLDWPIDFRNKSTSLPVLLHHVCFLKPVRSSLLLQPQLSPERGKGDVLAATCKVKKEESFSLPVYMSRRWEDASWKCSVSIKELFLLGEPNFHRLEIHHGKRTSTLFAVAQ